MFCKVETWKGGRTEPENKQNAEKSPRKSFLRWKRQESKYLLAGFYHRPLHNVLRQEVFLSATSELSAVSLRLTPGLARSYRRSTEKLAIFYNPQCSVESRERLKRIIASNNQDKFSI